MNNFAPFANGPGMGCCTPNYDSTVDQLLGNAYQVVKFVAMRMPFIKTLSDNIADIIALADSLDGLKDIEANLPALLALQANLDKLNILYNNLTSLVSVADNLNQILTVHDNLPQIETILDNIIQIVAVGNNITAVNNIYANMPAVSAVNSNMAEIISIFNELAAILSVANNMPAVVSVNNNLTNIGAVAGIAPSITVVADNVTDITNFADVYQGPKASNPTTRNNGAPLQNGDLYFNTTDDIMRVYGATGWVNFNNTYQNLIKRPPGNTPYVATAGQTSFAVAGGYTQGQIIVTLNGVNISDTAEVTLTSGTHIVLNTPASAGDELDYFAFVPFNVADTMSTADILESIDNAIDLAVVNHGQCRFGYVSPTQCILVPFNGNGLIVNNKQYRISSAGITLSNSGLGASAGHYVYAQDNGTNSGVLTLVAELAATSPYSRSANGVFTKTGDTSKTLVGWISTTASSQFQWTATDKRVMSWFNRKQAQCKENGTGSITTTTPAQMTSGVNIPAWAGSVVQVLLSGQGNATSGTPNGGYLSVRSNGVGVGGGYGYSFQATGDQRAIAITTGVEVATDGLQNIAPWVNVTTGSAAFQQELTVISPDC